MAKDLNWEQRPNGTFQAPPQAVPFLVIMMVLMIVLGVLAPHGLNNAKDEEGAVVVLVFLMLIGMTVLLVVFGRNEPGSTSDGLHSDPVPLTTVPASSPPQSPARPILRPALSAPFQMIGRAFSFRWVSRLSDWLQPIVWALVISSPAVAVIIRWRSDEWSSAGDGAFCLTFVGAGCAIGGLAHDGLRALRARREGKRSPKRAAARDRFRAILAKELRTRPIRDFDFSALVDQHAMPRFEADAAAAIVYRRFSDRVVADGVITIEESRRMDTLARMLEIGPDRVAVIEAAAKSDRFKDAVHEVLADCVVTEDEARGLESLRDSLGLSDADWQAGQDKIWTAKFNPSSSDGGQQHA